MNNFKTLSFLLGLQPSDPASVMEVAPTLNLGADDKVVPQLEAALRAAGLEGLALERIVFPGNGAAAIAMVALYEGAQGMQLPTHVVATAPFKGNAEVGEFNLANLRHNEARSLRDEFETDEENATANGAWLLLDGSGRPVPNQILLDLMRETAGATDITVVPLGMPAQRSVTEPWKAADGSTTTVDRLRALLADGAFTRADLMSGRVAFLPPGMGTAALCDAAIIYGVAESWPTVVRQAGTAPFPFAELVRVHELRQLGAQIAAELKTAEAPVLVPRHLLNEVVEALQTRNEEGADYGELLDELTTLLARGR